MSIVTIKDEAEALKKIWDSLTGLSIAWEIENTNIDNCEMIECKQSSGTRKGTWDNIPSENAEECGTQHDSIFGTHNIGGVVYALGNSGCYFGVAWDDPSVGSAQYGWAYGDENSVKKHIESLWDGLDGPDISGAASKTLVTGWGVTVKIQPGFDPFKISFSTSSSLNRVELSESNNSVGTPRKDKTETKINVYSRLHLAEKQEIMAKALMESAQNLRK
ncbi:hypothetical protein [uncultured Polaribacter sp.]|uniref:hypothetical protein n=1 Tax=uncultured Polaribacter sp. TaxID=174711 RepID=UPI002638712C|nr:hypothetical protein [uncultured Polaribacter sp.]